MNTIHREYDSVVIAGNGPSLAQIDYDLLPENIDIFRCNQFYMEDQYFLGKKIKAAFFNHQVFIEQQATMSVLTQNQEYECEQIVYSELETSLDKLELGNDIFNLFPDTINAFALYREKLPKLAKMTLNHGLINNEWITSGVIMAIIAVAMGYKKLYITGLDLYLGQQPYVFDSRKSNLIKLNPEFQTNETMIPSGFHSAKIDLAVLHILRELYDVEIQCISPTSPLAGYFPLASKTGYEQQNRAKYFLPKSENALKDIIIPNSFLYSYWRNKHFKIKS